MKTSSSATAHVALLRAPTDRRKRLHYRLLVALCCAIAISQCAVEAKGGQRVIRYYTTTTTNGGSGLPGFSPSYTDGSISPTVQGLGRRNPYDLPATRGTATGQFGTDMGSANQPVRSTGTGGITGSLPPVTGTYTGPFTEKIGTHYAGGPQRRVIRQKPVQQQQQKPVLYQPISTY